LVRGIKGNEDQRHSQEETLGKVIEVLLEALDPARLSLESFDLAAYFDSLLRSIGEKFGMSRIILRYEDRVDKNKLNPLATFGFNKAQVNELTSVTKDSSMAKHLASEESCYYAPNLLDPDTKFDQRPFAIQLGLKSSFACPILLNYSFVGFIIYYKTQGDGFQLSELEFLKKLNSIIQQVFLFAEKLSDTADQFIELSSGYSSALASLLISFHDAKGFLATEAEMIDIATNIVKNATFASNDDKEQTLFWLSNLSDSNKDVEGLIVSALRGEQQLSRIENLIELLKESLAPLYPQLHGVPVRFSPVGDEPFSIIGNSRQLRQVFFNIFYNAYRAIEEKQLGSKGIIDVSLSQDSKFVFVNITDNGIGIQSERLATIFTEGKSTWKTRTGTGMGLGLSRKILESIHVGKIEIESKYGSGTTVRITLRKHLETKIP
jgi:signal transduction histidine kinase